MQRLVFKMSQWRLVASTLFSRANDLFICRSLLLLTESRESMSGRSIKSPITSADLNNNDDESPHGAQPAVLREYQRNLFGTGSMVCVKIAFKNGIR